MEHMLNNNRIDRQLWTVYNRYIYGHGVVFNMVVHETAVMEFIFRAPDCRGLVDVCGPIGKTESFRAYMCRGSALVGEFFSCPNVGARVVVVLLLPLLHGRLVLAASCFRWALVSPPTRMQAEGRVPHPQRHPRHHPHHHCQAFSIFPGNQLRLQLVSSLSYHSNQHSAHHRPPCNPPQHVGRSAVLPLPQGYLPPQ